MLMSAYRKAKNSDSAVGWISMTDLFLLVSILLLCSYASLTSDYRKVQSVADDQEKSLTVLQKDCASLRLAWEESEAKSVEMEKTYAMNIALREQKLQTSMNRQIELIQMKEVGVRKEILGLKGKMERTLFLFDRSQSMETEIANAKIDRWKHAQEILRTWLLYLPVRECAVITFNETLDGYPPRPGQYLKMTGVEGETNRQELLRWLTSITPEGNTNTEVALQLAVPIPRSQLLSFCLLTVLRIFTKGKFVLKKPVVLLFWS